jgi:hypothetical protein
MRRGLWPEAGLAASKAAVEAPRKAEILVLQGIIFVVLLTSETLYGRIPLLQPRRTGDRT